MSLVLLISDFQTGSFKIGLLKQRIVSSGQKIEIIDISHDIRLNNTIEAAFVAAQLQNSGNQENIILISQGKSKRLIVYQHLLNLYILPDNGLLTMMFEQPDMGKVYAIERHREADAIRLFREKMLHTLPSAMPGLVKRYMKQPQVNGNYITTEFIYSDKHGNCYFDLRKDVFDAFAAGRKYRVRIQHYPSIEFDNLDRDVADVPPGDALFSFSSSGFLQLQMNMGNARQLFRIRDDTKIIIERS